MNKDELCEMLQHEFVHGKVPKNLDGYYRGKLMLLFPKTLPEYAGSFLLKLYLPWRGKRFDKAKQTGDNMLPGGIRAFPFRTSLTTALHDNIKVFRLDYNLPKNPKRVRDVIDELVCVEKDVYLGKAHIKDGKSYRTVAFFRLSKEINR